MKIAIKTLKNVKHDIEVEESLTVGELKARIESEHNLGEPASQKLIFSGKILKDDQTLGSAKVKEGDFIVIMVSKARAIKKKTPVATPAPAAASSSTTPAPVATPAAATLSPSSVSSASPAAAPTTSSGSAPAPASVAPASAESALVQGPAYEEMVTNLMALGFPRDQVAAALRAAFNNPDRAAQYLFNGIPESAERELAAAEARARAMQQAAASGAPNAADPAAEADADAPVDESGIPSLAGLGGSGQQPSMGDILGLVQQNPALIPIMMQRLRQENPELFQQLAASAGTTDDAQLAQVLLQGLAQAEQAQQGGPNGPRVIRVTQEEKEALERLESLGFPRELVLEAYLICDKNEELAANYLLENGANFAMDFEDAPPSGNDGAPPS